MAVAVKNEKETVKNEKDVPSRLVCTAKLVGISPLSFGKVFDTEKPDSCNEDKFDAEHWKERLHVNGDGGVFIPPQALKNMLSNVAKYKSEKIPGKRNATYTKHFKSGILVVDPMCLGLKPDDFACEKLFVPSDGKTGGGSRVWRRFPIVHKWGCEVTIHVSDPVLTTRPELMHRYLADGGKFIGLLRNRPQNGGGYGRYEVKDWKYEEIFG